MNKHLYSISLSIKLSQPIGLSHYYTMVFLNKGYFLTRYVFIINVGMIKIFIANE